MNACRNEGTSNNMERQTFDVMEKLAEFNLGPEIIQM
jgi:hypothetical protein